MGFGVGSTFIADVLRRYLYNLILLILNFSISFALFLICILSLVLIVVSSFETDYTPNRWGCGTVLSSVVYKESHTKPHLSVVPPHAFYPIGYQNIAEYLSKHSEEVWETIKHDSYALHLFGKTTQKEQMNHGSMIYKALTEFALSNTNFT